MKWLLLFLHLFFFHFPSFSCFNFLCHHDEYSALLHFKSSFAIGTADYYPCDESLMKTTTWKNGSDCCSWHGVTCDTVSGHVIGLNLGCESLIGILHPNSTLFHLPHLQTLNLFGNHFFPSQFHSKFGEFQSLTHLNLSFCDFQGDVPPQISHLSKLTSLHLSYNSELIWKETTLKRLVQNATNLKEVFLDSTNMSSIKLNSIDLLFNHSSSLVTLNLGRTGLSGKFEKWDLCLPSIQELYMSGGSYYLHSQLPELSCSVFLRILDFSYNHFHGPIPLSFSNLTLLTSLSLNSNSLNSSIPSSLLILPCLTSLDLSLNDLSGQIPNVFHQSNRFQKLDLSYNKIGGELPISLSNLHHLIGLYLSNNSFKGQIPDVFGGMTKLQELNLDSNNLEGQIPSSLFNLNQLVTLDCSHNKLVGPLMNKFSGFPKLTYLALDNNLLNGTIPSSLLSLPCLKRLSLTNNRITGHIGAISSYSLEDLNLCNNKLQGNIPKSIFNLSNLTVLCLSSNNLSGVVDFHHFFKLQNLQHLSLSYNSQLSLNIETNVNDNFSQLLKLELSSLNLNELPKFIGKLPSLSFLDISNNKFNGRVPNWLLETTNSLLNLSQNMFTSIDHISRSSYQLRYLDLSYNLLQGELSASICNISSLQFLNLAHNKLAGTIPQCLVSLSSLQVLDLQMNKFYGTFPNHFSKDCELLTLNLFDNHLDRFPETLSQCKYLEVLNLGSNRIEDKFPDWLQTLQNLKVLVLRDNKLHGSIANLKVNYPFPSLIIFDISGNNISGPLPKTYFKKFEAMKNVIQDPQGMSYMEIDVDPGVLFNTFYARRARLADEFRNYYDSMVVTMKGINMAMKKIPTILVSMDLSRNKFEGEIPDVIGELHGLIGLNLSHNKLIGHIPQSMGNLTNLEWLDLSSNMLIGMIPPEFTNLNSLEVLDLSNNHLIGEIPQGKQFNTFSNDSYEGNLGLCGFPLSKKCGPQQHSPPSPSPDISWSEEKFGFGWKPVAIGYGCGFVFGIGIGYCMFLIGKPRWLVMIFGGKPKRRVKRRTRVRRTNGSTMNQMIQMS